jgi:hypothetical protein
VQAEIGADRQKTWRGVYLLALIGLAIRIILALFSDNIHHPDEVFQLLEQGHRAAFGYGYIPWEFRFGARSWITPGFISLILLAFKKLHIDNPNIYVPAIKIIFCVLSTSLIFSAYFLTRRLVSEKAAKISCFLVCFWYELIYFAHKPLTGVLAAYLFLAALAVIFSGNGKPKAFLAGLLLGLCLVIRFQLLPVILFMMVYLFFKWPKGQLLKLALLLFAVIIFAGVVDHVTWGRFFISYYNSYLFNKVYGVSSIFGIQSFFFYFSALFCVSAGIFVVALFLSVIRLREVWLPLTCVSIILLSHIMIPHKEYRFVFAAVPLLLIIIAVLMGQIGLQKKPLKLFLTAGFLFVSVLGVFCKLPFQKSVYYSTPYANDGRLAVYKTLANEANISAVLDVSSQWFNSGGYYYLHKDVPIYFPWDFVRSSGDSGVRQIDPDELSKYVSHIVCSPHLAGITGYETILRVRDIDVRMLKRAPREYQRLDSYTREVFQEGIDGKYDPKVKRRI